MHYIYQTPLTIHCLYILGVGCCRQISLFFLFFPLLSLSSAAASSCIDHSCVYYKYLATSFLHFSLVIINLTSLNIKIAKVTTAQSCTPPPSPLIFHNFKFSPHVYSFSPLSISSRARQLHHVSTL